MKKTIRATLAVAFSVFFLSACGSSGGGESNGTTSVEVDGNTTDASVGDTTGESTDNETGDSADNSTDSTPASTDPEPSDNSDGGALPVPEPQSDPTPIVRAPADAEILLSQTLMLNGSVTLLGMPIDIPVIEWTKNFGPGWANFEDSQSVNTTILFDQAGTYELQLTATNGTYSAFDTMQVIVISDVVNQAPVVKAGADQSLMIDGVLNLSAIAEDDGLPMGNLFSEWSKLSGPGEVFFGEVSSAETTATFDAAGVYVLQFVSSDGELSGNDVIEVTVNGITAPTPTPPVASSVENINAANSWQVVNTANGSKPQARHEAGAVAFQNQLYLMGGRSTRQLNRYNPATNQWENLGTPNFEFNHFQPVVYNGKIYVVGSLNCCYPSESVLPRIQIYDPATKNWSQGATLPQNRRRGSAGTVVYNNKIYLVGGSTNGHDGGMVNWFDEYSPANDAWTTLPNAPNQRDHFSAAMVGNKLVAAGGRKTDFPNTFSNLVTAVDIYDFGTGQWHSGAPIKTKRAGAVTVSVGEEVILIGGESDSGLPALSVVEAYNVNTNQWRTLNSLRTARHSGGAAIIDGAIHVVSGNTTTGGGSETQSHERLLLK